MTSTITVATVAAAAALKPGKTLGREQLYHCPRHDDKHPSLSLNTEKDVFLCGPCGAGGTAWQLAAFLAGVDPGDKDGVKEWLTERGLFNSTERRILAEYRYDDETGAHLFDVVRFEPKDFRQRKPDGTWNLQGARRVPYRLPQVLAAVDVFIVEGEKDVDRLNAIGLTATCNPGGSGKWRDEYSGLFRPNQHVCIIPDNDDPGREHARKVANSMYGKVGSVKVLDLPGLPTKGDVSDWLQGRDMDSAAEELSILADHAPAWEPDTTVPPSPSNGLPFVGMRELLNEPEETTSWLVDGLLPMAGDSLCVAKPKVGKSTWARCLALAVARGDDFLGRQTHTGTVFYLALEEKRAEVRRHFIDMGARDDDPIFVFCATSPADGLDLLREAMKLRNPVLVIVDPLFRFVRVKDGNDYNAVTNALEPLHTLARESGAHVMALHHAGKAGDRDAGDSVLGSTAIFASVDTLLIMKRHDKYRTISSVQRYGTDLEEITLDYNENTRTLSAGVARADADVAAATKGIVDFLQNQSEPVEWRAIDDAVEGRKQTKLQALKQTQKLGTTIRSGNGKKGDPYLYSVSGSAGSAYKAGTTELQSVTTTNEKTNAGSRLFVQGWEPEITGNQKGNP